VLDEKNSPNTGCVFLNYVFVLKVSFVFDSSCITDSSTNKTDRHDITEILLKVALNIINQQTNR